jgi:hypothetical protein
MSKIPSGEWNAIAARHAKGESLSAIARSYGCTPPAIHYVLKRNEQQTSEKVEKVEKAPIVEQPVESPPPASNEFPGQAHPPTQPPNGEIRLVPRRENAPANGGSREPAPPTNGPVRSEQHAVPSERRPLGGPAVELQQHPGSPRTTGRGLAFTDGLDSELHDRVEAAIETFRSCFDAALAEGSPHERARLRQAASDLMRVAARTTIVLDRLNALSERAAARFDPRSNRNWPT